MRKTALQNRVRQYLPNVEFHLKNVNVNESKRGCSGFIVNTKTDTILYVQTEDTFNQNRVLFRYARDLKDYVGFYNQYSPTANDEFIEAIVHALTV